MSLPSSSSSSSDPCGGISPQGLIKNFMDSYDITKDLSTYSILCNKDMVFDYINQINSSSTQAPVQPFDLYFVNFTSSSSFSSYVISNYNDFSYYNNIKLTQVNINDIKNFVKLIDFIEFLIAKYDCFNTQNIDLGLLNFFMNNKDKIISEYTTIIASSLSSLSSLSSASSASSSLNPISTGQQQSLFGLPSSPNLNFNPQSSLSSSNLNINLNQPPFSSLSTGLPPSFIPLQSQQIPNGTQVVVSGENGSMIQAIINSFDKNSNMYSVTLNNGNIITVSPESVQQGSIISDRIDSNLPQKGDYVTIFRLNSRDIIDQGFIIDAVNINGEPFYTVYGMQRGIIPIIMSRDIQKIQPPEIKLGDKVIFTTVNNNINNVATQTIHRGTITRINNDDTYNITDSYKNPYNDVASNRIKKVDDYPKPKFKVGDVVITRNAADTGIISFIREDPTNWLSYVYTFLNTNNQYTETDLLLLSDYNKITHKDFKVGDDVVFDMNENRDINSLLSNEKAHGKIRSFDEDTGLYQIIITAGPNAGQLVRKPSKSIGLDSGSENANNAINANDKVMVINAPNNTGIVLKRLQGDDPSQFRYIVRLDNTGAENTYTSLEIVKILNPPTLCLFSRNNQDIKGQVKLQQTDQIGVGYKIGCTFTGCLIRTYNQQYQEEIVPKANVSVMDYENPPQSEFKKGDKVVITGTTFGININIIPNTLGETAIVVESIFAYSDYTKYLYLVKIDSDQQYSPDSLVFTKNLKKYNGLQTIRSSLNIGDTVSFILNDLTKYGEILKFTNNGNNANVQYLDDNNNTTINSINLNQLTKELKGRSIFQQGETVTIYGEATFNFLRCIVRFIVTNAYMWQNFKKDCNKFGFNDDNFLDLFLQRALGCKTNYYNAVLQIAGVVAPNPFDQNLFFRFIELVCNIVLSVYPTLELGNPLFIEFMTKLAIYKRSPNSNNLRILNDVLINVVGPAVIMTNGTKIRLEDLIELTGTIVGSQPNKLNPKMFDYMVQIKNRDDIVCLFRQGDIAVSGSNIKLFLNRKLATLQEDPSQYTNRNQIEQNFNEIIQIISSAIVAICGDGLNRYPNLANELLEYIYTRIEATVPNNQGRNLTLFKQKLSTIKLDRVYKMIADYLENAKIDFQLPKLKNNNYLTAYQNTGTYWQFPTKISHRIRGQVKLDDKEIVFTNLFKIVDQIKSNDPRVRMIFNKYKDNSELMRRLHSTVLIDSNLNTCLKTNTCSETEKRKLVTKIFQIDDDLSREISKKKQEEEVLNRQQQEEVLKKEQQESVLKFNRRSNKRQKDRYNGRRRFTRRGFAPPPKKTFWDKIRGRGGNKTRKIIKSKKSNFKSKTKSKK